MNTKRWVSLVAAMAVLAVAAAGAAFFIKGEDAADSPRATLLSAPDAARAAAIVIGRNGGSVRLARAGNGWVIPGKANLPAQADKVAALLSTLQTAPLRDDEQSRRAASGAFPLGNVIQMSVEADDGTMLVDHELGAPVSTPGGQTLAKRPARARAHPEDVTLIDGRLEIDRDPMDWLDRSVIDLPRGRVLAVETGPGGARLAIRRPSVVAPDFARVDGAAAGFGGNRNLTLADVAGGLENITMDDARPAGSADQAPALEARFETIDGLVVQVSLLREGEATWARFATAVVQPAARSPEAVTEETASASDAPAAGAALPWTEVLAEAAALNDRLAGREFRLPERSATRLMATPEDIVR